MTSTSCSRCDAGTLKEVGIALLAYAVLEGVEAVGSVARPSAGPST